MRRPTTVAIGMILALVVASAPAWAGYRQAGRGHWGEEQAFRIQFGAFTPDGESDYWTEKELDFTGDADDFEDFTAGVEYVRFLGPRLGLVVAGHFYSGETSQHYLDFIDDAGFEIFHRTSLDLANFTLGLLFHLTRRDAAVVPYVGAGGGLFLWTLSEAGDFIDFDRDFEIFYGDFEDEGTTFGWYVQAGLEVPLAPNWSIYGDARWEQADADLGGEFEGLGELDLSGVAYSLGFSFSF